MDYHQFEVLSTIPDGSALKLEFANIRLHGPLGEHEYQHISYQPIKAFICFASNSAL